MFYRHVIVHVIPLKWFSMSHFFFENYTIIKCGHGAGVEENYCHSNLFKLSSPIII